MDKEKTIENIDMFNILLKNKINDSYKLSGIEIKILNDELKNELGIENED